VVDFLCGLSMRELKWLLRFALLGLEMNETKDLLIILLDSKSLDSDLLTKWLFS